MKRITYILFLLCRAHADHYIVDGENGDDTNDGLHPNIAFRTIQRCVDELQNPGDECQIRSGRYHEVIHIEGLFGTAEKPIIIKGFNDERPIWDGTIPIHPQPDGWEYDENTGICEAYIEEDIIALFLDDDLLTAARWPNALWSDKTVFNNTYFAKCDDASSFGNIVDDGTGGGIGLADSGIDATGAMAILNIGSWTTYVRPVLDHEVGSSNFTYNHDMGNIHWKPGHLQYYLEASLELLDSPGEWFYDKDEKKLYLIPPFKGCPDVKSSSLRGRTIDYGLTITDTKYLTIANMTFFGANVNAYSVYFHDSDIDEITLESVQFKFPSSSHRMLQSTDYPLVTKLIAKGKQHGEFIYGRVSVVNCTFEGGEGGALEYDGQKNYIHNNLFSFNEWSGQTNSGGGGGSILDFGIDNEFSQNTMWHNGNSAGFRAGLGAKIEYNNIVGQCAGKILNDGSGIQVSEKLVNNTRISHNWVHDSLPKHGIRFDTPEPSEGRLGYGGYMGYNVVWHVNGMTVKGDSHDVENNIAFDRADSGKCTLCVYYRVWHDPVIQNNNTIVLNNGATQADGGHSVDFDGNWPLAGEVVENNYSGEDVKSHMVDAANWDFRPVPGGAFDQDITIGPYKPGFESSHYYIPGRRLYKTSMPIPHDGSSVPKNRDAVIFLEGDMANEHHFYLGTDKETLDKASLDDEEYQFSFLAEDGNILPLPELDGNTQYFWRVDVQQAGYIYKGDIWSFYTISD